MQKINRRQMMQILGAGAASVYLGGCTRFAKKPDAAIDYHDWIHQIGPVDRSIGDHAPLIFSGDNPTQNHEILWNKAAFLKKHGGISKPTEESDLVIVGGGMSGLLSAYFLKDLNPMVIDQAPRLGGNSRAESWRGLDYSLATAYFNIPEKGTPIDRFFKGLGIDKMFRNRDANDPIFIDGVRYDDIWDKGTNAESAPQFQKLTKLLEDTLAQTNGARYPKIPFETESERAFLEELDKMSFKEFVEKHFNEPLHPHLETVIEYYFWSAAASSSTEMSAAGGLKFFADDFGAIGVTPGGNGAIAEVVLKDLAKTMAADRFRVNSLVFDVRVQKDHALVSYWDGNRIHTIKAKAVIMSCPKFIVARITEGLEQKRKKVYRSLRYRSYMVANLLIDENLEDNFYDLFFFQGGALNTQKIRDSALKQKITDVVYGNYAKPKQPQTVLTFFRGFPYDQAREEILVPDAYTKYRSEFEKQIYTEVLPQLKINRSKVVDLRIARWGHPLPLNEKGTFARDKVEWLRKPFAKRVFFVEQDNWMLPAFETCFDEAHYWTPKVRAVLG